MAIRVLIERRFREGILPQHIKIINNLRIGAMNQPGYVGGETLISRENRRDVLVISTWANLEDWYAWRENRDRSAMEQQLGDALSEPAGIREFVVAADALREIFAEIVHDKDAAEAE